MPKIDQEKERVIDNIQGYFKKNCPAQSCARKKCGNCSFLC